MRLAVTVFVFCVAALMALGMVMLYSSSMAQVGTRYLTVQLTWMLLGLGACAIAALIDYRLLKKFAVPLLILSVILLALLFVPKLGIHRKGATRWLGYNNVSFFQPSEIAKLALIIAVAWYGDRYQRHMQTFRRGIVIPGIVIAAVLTLIYKEPDRGTTILMAGVTGAMLLIGGARWKSLVPPLLLAAVGLTISLLHDPMRLRRIMSWLHPEEHKAGVGYQAYQSMVALGSGGMTGLGLGNGRQKMGFVPEHHTDFIFSIIGEELGLVATLLVVLAFVLILITGIVIAIHAPDSFGLLLGAGITFLIAMQAFINIGVVTSALPNKGIALPFISYGGSNLLMMMGSVGLLLGIARQGQTNESPDDDGLSRERKANPFARIDK